MPNIKLQYQYRDYANYKNYKQVVFANPDNLSLEHIEATLRANLMDDEYFYVSRWCLKDLHFDKYDDEIDHPYHQYLDVELTDEAATEALNTTEFLDRVIKGGNKY